MTATRVHGDILGELTRKAYLLSTSGSVKHSHSPQGIRSGDLTEASQIDMEIPGLGTSFSQNMISGDSYHVVRLS